MTNIFSTLFDARTLPEIVLIAVVIVVVIAIVVALFCLCNCCCKLCIETDDFDIEVPKQDVPPPSYLRNETVNMNQVQNHHTYDYETLPQPLPEFGLPKRPTIHNNLQNGISTALPSAPQAYSENSNRTCQSHANCQNSPQPLPRFHGSQRISSSTNQYNTHNELSSMLSSTSPLDSDPPPYSEIFNGERLNGTWVHHSNSETLPQSLPGASAPESEAIYNTENETTTSPNPILYSYSS